MVQITWLGHAGFKLVLNDGRIMYIDAWLENPKCPDAEKNVEKADIVLVTHGHFDHSSSSPEIAEKTGAKFLSNFEICQWASAGTGAKVKQENLCTMNKGGMWDFKNGLTVQMVTADHSSGCPGGDAPHHIMNGGEPVGYVITTPEGVVIYHAGDTNVFGDMKIISELYKPTVALLPIGGIFTMAEKEAAYALKHLLTSVTTVVPMHFGTFPLLTGTPDGLRSALAAVDHTEKVKVVEMTPGQTISL